MLTRTMVVIGRKIVTPPRRKTISPGSRPNHGTLAAIIKKPPISTKMMPIYKIILPNDSTAILYLILKLTGISNQLANALPPWLAGLNFH